MKTLLASAVVAFTLLSSAAAQATTFQFSYLFSGGPVVTGTFDGVASGNLITGLSNISVYADGSDIADSTPLQSYSYDFFTGDWTPGGTASFDGTANNFIFADDGKFSFTRYFGIASLYSPSPTDDAELSLASGAFYQEGGAGTVAAHWSVSAVPEPETYAMLLAGLGLVGFAARRRA